MADYCIQLTVNGRQVRREVNPTQSLLRFLRDGLHLTDVKCGCEKGDCGTCTVILDGQPVKSCLVLAAQADGCSLQTLKGVLAEPLVLELQESFVNHGAVQCGFCTPGMVLTAKSLLEQNPRPDRAEIRRAIAGNLCRCTGYKKIVDAIEAVAAVGGPRPEVRT